MLRRVGPGSRERDSRVSGPRTRAEATQFLRRVSADGQVAKREISVGPNLRLVVSIAKRYAPRGMTLLDLRSRRAVVWSHPRRSRSSTTQGGYKFSTYATWWIRQAVSRAIADQSRTIRIPVHITRAHQRGRPGPTATGPGSGREPQAREIGRHLGIPARKGRRDTQGIKRSPVLRDSRGRDGRTCAFGEPHRRTS